MLMRSWQRGQEEINDIDSSNDISGKMIVIEKRDYDDGLFVQKQFLGKGLVLSRLVKQQHR